MIDYNKVYTYTAEELVAYVWRVRLFTFTPIRRFFRVSLKQYLPSKPLIILNRTVNPVEVNNTEPMCTKHDVKYKTGLFLGLSNIPFILNSPNLM